jgi:hypothetical protein
MRLKQMTKMDHCAPNNLPARALKPMRAQVIRHFTLVDAIRAWVGFILRLTKASGLGSDVRGAIRSLNRL